MSLIEPSSYTSAMPSEPIVNTDLDIVNKIKGSGSGKDQLKKVAKEFESIFISKMFSTMDQSVDKEGGLFGEETKYIDTLKPYMYSEVGRSIANNPHSSFGLAKQVYEQMEKYVK